jgi:hypothetical protein
VAEAITEMIIPGTYIEVRAEGLIGVSGIATGNVGIVGTASKGPVGEAIVLSSFSEARETFGDYDGWGGGSKNELTLVRALQLLFDNGASTVYAVRTADANAAATAALRKLGDTTGTVVTLFGKTPGTWAHEVRAQVKTASTNALVEERKQTVGAGPLQPLHANIAPSAQNVVRVVKGATGKIFRFPLKTSGAASPGKVTVNPATGEMTFDAADKPVAGDTIIASYEIDKSAARDIEIAYKNLKETYTVIDATDIRRDINGTSNLVTVEIEAGADARVPDVMAAALPLEGASNGETASASDYKTSLARLDTEPVNIALLAGQSVARAAATLLAHVEATENTGRDRIAVVGADGDDASVVSANADTISDDRLILVAPGVKSQDLTLGTEVSLNASYAAAAVAGVVASLAVHVSPTNKVLRVPGLTKFYNDGELKKLLGNRVMALEKKAGFRIVKGITTDDGAFRQVSVRRIVDYAKAGTRIGSNPYIGRLNNARVRGALKATLNGFLSDMVLNEALTEFTLDVTATRAQEITGVAVVTMFLKPTFSIDYIKVIMNLS